ncbi:hypothetical protein BV25DRAFT_607538 [Artomyces pyxidatus]|uniref:Uncharacterized protein n=1 Tax=Artomyces pyxidatus TaxID=48021 RepID=A0ACB8T1W2_9AGAM|nr:hypothetical protein BV25DRAFT_607538 [Artomyces pyxidatus]
MHSVEFASLESSLTFQQFTGRKSEYFRKSGARTAAKITVFGMSAGSPSAPSEHAICGYRTRRAVTTLSSSPPSSRPRFRPLSLYLPPASPTILIFRLKIPHCDPNSTSTGAARHYHTPVPPGLDSTTSSLRKYDHLVRPCRLTRYLHTRSRALPNTSELHIIV